MCESKEVSEHLGSSRCKVHTVGLCWGAPEILGRQLLPFRVEHSITASLVLSKCSQFNQAWTLLHTPVLEVTATDDCSEGQKL